MAQTTQEPLGKVEQMLVDMIDGEPIVEAPENKIQGLLMELADVIAQGGGGGGGGGITKYAQLPDKPRINDVELSGNKSFSQLGLNIQNTPVNGSNDPISSGGVYNALANKVTKETGKSLTSNDFTNALLAKLNAIESGAQVNLIEKILVNGVEVAPSNKAVALTVMTNTVENLVNYYKKSETYSQSEIDQLISQISGGITLEVVEELPETEISTSTIYLIEAGENVYTQYLYSSVDEEWKILGSTTVDLSNYYTKTQVDTLLAGKQDTLEYDNAPTASSEKMVKSGGIYNALQGKQDTLEYDNTPTEDSQKMVKSGAIWEALEGKQDTLEWDSVPTAGSTKSLTSGAIKTALDGLDAAGKADKVEGATDGDLAALDSDGNLTDSGKKASDFATPENVQDSINTSADLLKDTVGWTGKNLLKNTATSQTVRGVTFTVNSDGSVTANGTATGGNASLSNWGITLTLPAGKYIFSGCPSGGANTYALLIQDEPYTQSIFDYGDGVVIDISETKTFHPYFGYVRDGVTVSNLTFRPMIRRADITDPTYEPYHESVETMYEEEIHGVNLFNVKPFTKTGNGMTITVADNIATLNGTPSANTGFGIKEFYSSDLADGETYTISDGGTSNYSNCYIYINGVKHDGSTVYDVVRLQTKATLKTDFSTYRKYALGVYTRTEAGALSNKKFYLMIRKADIEDSTYRPYNEQAIQNQLNAQGVLGAKNFWSWQITNQTKNGVTWTQNTDGSILANGATTNAQSDMYSLKFTFKKAGKYILTGKSNNVEVGLYNFQTSKWYWSNNTNPSILIDVLNTTDEWWFSVVVRTNKTVNNETIYPMLRLASDPDDTYQSYAMTNRELTVKSNTLASAMHFSIPSGGETVTKNFKTKHGYQRFLVFAYAGAWEAVILIQMKKHNTSVGEINIYTTDNTKSLSPVYNSDTSITLTFAAQGQYDIISAEPFEVV